MQKLRNMTAEKFHCLLGHEQPFDIINEIFSDRFIYSFKHKRTHIQ